MGLTENGYTRLTYEDIVENKILKAQELFGEDIDTSEQTALGKLIRIDAYDLAKAEETAEMIYYARFPHTASGVSLDRLCVFVGISRNSATPSTYKVKVTGTPGYTIPSDFLVSTESGLTFYNTDLEKIIGDDGTCEIIVECTTSGEVGNITYSDITEIVNPDADIESVIGTSTVTLGTDEESDFELRNRFDKAKTGLGSCNEVAIQSAIIRIPTVTSVRIIANETDQTDSDSRPPHSFECFVNGGEGYEQEIAQIIYEKKPIGIKAYGDSYYTVTDEGGFEHSIGFSKTQYVDVIVKLQITTDSTFEGDNGKAEIKKSLSSVINSLGVGTSLILSTLYGYIYDVKGVTEVTSLSISTDGGKSYQTTNLDVDDWESIRCTNVVTEVTT